MKRLYAHDIMKTNFLRATTRALLLGTAALVAIIAANERAQADCTICDLVGSALNQAGKDVQQGEQAIGTGLQNIGNTVDRTLNINQPPSSPLSQDDQNKILAPSAPPSATVSQQPNPDAYTKGLQALVSSKDISAAMATVISNDGGSILSEHGGGVISNDGGSLRGAVMIQQMVGPNGAGLTQAQADKLVASGGGNLIGNAGGTLVSNSGGTLVSNSGGTLIGNDGSTFKAMLQSASVSAAQAAQIVAGLSTKGSSLLAGLQGGASSVVLRDANLLIGNDGSSVVANDGASYSLKDVGTPPKALMAADWKSAATKGPTPAQQAQQNALTAVNIALLSDQTSLSNASAGSAAQSKAQGAVLKDAAVLAVLTDGGKAMSDQASQMIGAATQALSTAQNAAQAQVGAVNSDLKALNDPKNNLGDPKNADLLTAMQANLKNDQAKLTQSLTAVQTADKAAQNAVTFLQPYMQALGAAPAQVTTAYGSGVATVSPDLQKGVTALNTLAGAGADGLAAKRAAFTAAVTPIVNSGNMAVAKLPVTGQTAAQQDAASNLAAQQAAAAAKSSAQTAALAVAQSQANAAQGAAQQAAGAAGVADAAYNKITGGAVGEPANIVAALAVNQLGADKALTDAAAAYVKADAAVKAAVASGAPVSALLDAKAASSKALMIQELDDPNGPLPKGQPAGFFPGTKSVNATDGTPIPAYTALTDASGKPIIFYEAVTRASAANADL